MRFTSRDVKQLFPPEERTIIPVPLTDISTRNVILLRRFLTRSKNIVKLQLVMTSWQKFLRPLYVWLLHLSGFDKRFADTLYKPFDVAVAFLVFMFLAVPARRKLLARLRQQLRPGGAIIVFDKLVPPGGYPATVLARLTWASKLDQGAEPGAVVRKELSLSGIQRPLYPGELGEDAVEVFRFGDFAGWIIEG